MPAMWIGAAIALQSWPRRPLGKVSVVMIAWAAISMASSRRSATRAGITAVIRSYGSGSPITPVEDENTRLAGRPSASATPPVTAATASSPDLAGKGVGVARVHDDRRTRARRAPSVASLA